VFLLVPGSSGGRIEIWSQITVVLLAGSDIRVSGGNIDRGNLTVASSSLELSTAPRAARGVQ